MNPRTFTAWLGLATAGLITSLRADNATSLTCTASGYGGDIKAIDLDLAKMQACDDRGCVDLKPSARDIVKYDCVAGKTDCVANVRSDQTIVVSSAGPRWNEDHFTYNRATGRFRRYGSGISGDHGVREFHDDFFGTCRPSG
jgi:hypothetical protein